MSFDLDGRRAVVIETLARAMRRSGPQRQRLLGVKGAALASATEANLSIQSAPTLPAIERYTGVLFEALDHRSLPAVLRRRLNGSVCVVSGLWGLVTPADPIPDYKLKMGATLPRLGKLSTWWREDLSTALVDRARGRTVWNLLPAEHAAAWRAPDGLAQWSVRFLERRADGELVAVSHRNKFLKGGLVRFLLANPDAGPDELAAWDHPAGYRLDPDLTDERDGVTILAMVQVS